MPSENDGHLRTLVIACGNPLRCDDGVAWLVAQEIERQMPPFARITCVHQLTPELAESVSQSDTVIFIDAGLDTEPGRVLCRALAPDSAEVRFSHVLAPPQVLALCRRLYGTEPRAFLISVGGKCFDHGEKVSPEVTGALPQAIAAVNLAARQASDTSSRLGEVCCPDASLDVSRIFRPTPTKV